ncbi:5'-methylthioadenosine/adenosylhomocysteine nucleosidase [Thermobrachium celere]|uniref:5'-methylthioadenosine/adenosylhomocysteine nucleosidase n=1 Tax=Thermobrachium celere TaxID=53422 RepID=UPI0019455DFD|nr:5'-methylthioadenosine/adenosylhomocysteine nucleosidase [Thermobrachium celere]GFR35036.1 5'-methylthioadenosine/S-adenosylhomocysteine nucleosidase [Thermobrachium celere]
MRIGIIGAMDEEVIKIKESMEVERIEKKANMEFYMGKFLGKEVVVVRSGIGKVNAAVCTQILIDDFNVDAVINTGIAGGVYSEINVGDVVVSTDLVHHDFDTTAFGYEVGQIPRMEVYSFKADEKLIDIAIRSAEALKDFKVYSGRIISGDQFINSREKISYFREKFNAYAVEMEGAAIAHVCYLNNVPFVVIRSISDKADGSAHVDYPTFMNKAIENSIGILSNMIRAM